MIFLVVILLFWDIYIKFESLEITKICGSVSHLYRLHRPLITILSPTPSHA